jgi:putative membrane-bound dehydrogenase-like protein
MVGGAHPTLSQTLFAAIVVFISAGAEHPESPPLSPDESLKKIHVREGFEVELMAAEPMVIDPVAFDWGPDGKLWVVEMIDYPLGMDGKWKPGGRVRVLEDTNDDGRYDRATVFLDGLAIPSGLLPWRSGVLVAAAPEIFYAEDTDGDGRADVRQTLYRGFKPGNPQLRINGLRYGLDNWVYCANGWSGGVVESVRTGAKVDMNGRDLRIRPDTGDIDVASGVSQFGRNRDDWDNWFGQNNSNPLWHYVHADHDLRRNPHAPSPDPIVQLVTPANPRVYPAKKPEKRYHTFEQSGHYTSACSAMIYRDQLLFGNDDTGKGGDLRHAFTCEPFHNLVQHFVVREHGVTFRAERDPKEKEIDFFASADRWCRPSMVRTGPDGALWIADMYRYVIEHPEYLTPDGKKELEPFYRLGDDRGRLYRVFPKNKRPRRIPRLDRLSLAELVAGLESPSGWQRDTIQMMLIWRNDPAVVDRLHSLYLDSKHPLARAHALCTLDDMDRLPAPLVRQAIVDSDPGVRRIAVRLAEMRAVTDPTLANAFSELLLDRDEKVHVQLAIALGRLTDKRAVDQLAALACGADDPHLAAAIVSSLGPHNVGGVSRQLLKKLASGLGGIEEPRAALRILDGCFRVAAASGMNDVLSDSLYAIAGDLGRRTDAWQFAAASHWLEAITRAKISLDRLTAAKAPSATPAEVIAALFDRARSDATHEGNVTRMRIAAIGLLAHCRPNPAAEVKLLAELLVPQSSGELQAAVVASLTRLGHETVPGVLLAGWKSHSPEVRSRVLDALMARDAWIAALLDAAAAKAVAPADIDAARRQRLLTHRTPAIRDRAKKLFDGAIESDRKKVVAEYETEVGLLKADTKRGVMLFAKHCANCHQYRGQGHAVGPDLAALGDRSVNKLVTSMLDPGQALEPRFLSYAALTKDGQNVTGILVAETSASITLAGPDGKREQILRADLDNLQNSGKSLMPDGLEKELSPQDVADVVAYLREEFRQ